MLEKRMKIDVAYFVLEFYSILSVLFQASPSKKELESFKCPKTKNVCWVVHGKRAFQQN